MISQDITVFKFRHIFFKTACPFAKVRELWPVGKYHPFQRDESQIEVRTAAIVKPAWSLGVSNVTCIGLARKARRALLSNTLHEFAKGAMGERRYEKAHDRPRCAR